MFLMTRLVSRSSRSLAVMLGAAMPGQGRARDCAAGQRLLSALVAGPAFLQYPAVPAVLNLTQSE